jgi:hypothetical protein
VIKTFRQFITLQNNSGISSFAISSHGITKRINQLASTLSLFPRLGEIHIHPRRSGTSRVNFLLCLQHNVDEMLPPQQEKFRSYNWVDAKLPDFDAQGTMWRKKTEIGFFTRQSAARNWCSSFTGCRKYQSLCFFFPDSCSFRFSTTLRVGPPLINRCMISSAHLTA